MYSWRLEIVRIVKVNLPHGRGLFRCWRLGFSWNLGADNVLLCKQPFAVIAAKGRDGVGVLLVVQVPTDRLQHSLKFRVLAREGGSLVVLDDVSVGMSVKIMFSSTSNHSQESMQKAVMASFIS